VIGDVQAHEGCNENRRECMESAKCHRKFGSETPSFYDGFTVKY
jgi:hypothetical protein